MPPLENRDLYFGLTGLSLGENLVSLGQGITLSGAFAKFLSPLTLVNTEPPIPGALKAAYWQCAPRESDVTSQLYIPAAVGKTFDERYELGRFVVALLRLWNDPAIGFHVLSSHDFSSLIHLPDTDRPVLIPIETFPRYFQLSTSEPDKVISGLNWVVENWEKAYRLYTSSSELRLAIDTLDAGQFNQNPVLTLVSLWGALEAVFSPSTTELKFRVSALIASYLKPIGEERLSFQKHVASLYDMRSAAAHGKPKHGGDHLLKTFELLRLVVLTIIHTGVVPTKEMLEKNLFGVKANA